jgi:hypothetical protein
MKMAACLVGCSAVYQYIRRYNPEESHLQKCFMLELQAQPLSVVSV